MVSANLGSHLEAIQHVVGGGHVVGASAEDAIDGVPPQWVVEPGSVDALAQVLGYANASGLRVVPRGGGSKLDWGNPPKGVDLVLSTRRLDRVPEHASGDMTATVQAGCTVAVLGSVLAQRGQRLALDPLWPQRATIGGILAANDNGALRAAFGTLRDHLIGITVVLADGTVARSGGKVVKNVAGYDLPKLFTGSFGTLGVITEATFRLYPVARAAQTLRFLAPTDEVSGRVLSALASCSHLTSAVQIEAEADRPTTILVLVESLPQAMTAKVQQVIGAAVDCGSQQLQASTDAWTSREQLFSDRQSCVCKISLLPTQWLDFLQYLREVAARSGAGWQIVAQAVGVGLVRLTPRPAGAPVSSLIDTIAALRAHLEKTAGSLVVLRCPLEVKGRIDVWPDAGNALPLMRRIKDQFDRNGVLAPGRFVGGI